jgi:hypothetical protein
LCNIRGSYRGIAEVAVLLRCYALSFIKQLPTFARFVVVLGLLDSEDENIMILQNIGNFIPIDAV